MKAQWGNRPSFWGVVYLLLFFAYAIAYYILPSSSFYQPSAYLEVEQSNYERQLRQYLTGALRGNRSDPAVRMGAYIYVINDMVLTPLKLSKDLVAIEFNIMMPVLETENKYEDVSMRGATVLGDNYNDVVRQDWVNIPITLEIEPLRPDPNDTDGFLLVGGVVGNDPIPLSMADLFDVMRGGGIDPATRRRLDNRNVCEPFLLHVSKTAGWKLWDMRNGMLGEPTRIIRGLSRMFYMSAVTITTLGFGDIVPLTPLARTLIGSEALLGVIVMGCFVSAVSNRRR